MIPRAAGRQLTAFPDGVPLARGGRELPRLCHTTIFRVRPPRDV